MGELKKVIRGLESLWKCISPVSHTCGDCPYQDNRVECKRRVITDALALLKEQKPITPCIRGEEGFSYNNLTKQYGCGSCGKSIDRGDEFCRHCGKAVKWDGGRLNENL